MIDGRPVTSGDNRGAKLLIIDVSIDLLIAYRFIRKLQRQYISTGLKWVTWTALKNRMIIICRHSRFHPETKIISVRFDQIFCLCKMIRFRNSIKFHRFLTIEKLYSLKLLVYKWFHNFIIPYNFAWFHLWLLMVSHWLHTITKRFLFLISTDSNFRSKHPLRFWSNLIKNYEIPST